MSKYLLTRNLFAVSKMIYKISEFVERNRIVTNRKAEKSLSFHLTFYYKRSVNFNPNKTQNQK